MTTTVKVHVNGRYRTTVKQTYPDGRIVSDTIEGTNEGGTEKSYYLGHPARCTIELSEEYMGDAPTMKEIEDKKATE